MDSTLISIITVCYNSEKTIRATIESVLNQTYKNIEYILVDGKSADNTVEIIKSYEKEAEEKGITYRWISEEDRGIYDAMNKGISITTGELVGIINSDDWYEPDALFNIFNNFKKNDEILYFNIYKVLNGQTKIKSYGYINLENLDKISLNHPGMIIKKEVYLKKGMYSLKYPIAGDREFVIRNLKLGTNFRKINLFLSNFSLEGTSNQFDQFSKNFKRLKEEYFLLKVNKINKIMILKILLIKMKSIFGNYFYIKLFGGKKSNELLKKRMKKKFEVVEKYE